MNTHKQTVRTGYDVTIEGHDVYVEFDRVTTATRENYGADADGNRGMLMWMVDSDDAEQVTVNELPLSMFSDAVQRQVRATLDTYLADHEPEAEEEREPDFDDVGD